MEITEIIKDSFKFPANNIKALAIYIVLTFVIGLLIGGAALSKIYFANNSMFAILSVIAFIVALLVGFILSGYQIDVIKTGITSDELAPDFDVKNDFIRGIKSVVVAIVYYIIPAVIALIVAFITNMPAHILKFSEYITITNSNGGVMLNNASTSVPADVVSSLFGSVSITLLISALFFVIFSFILLMANARLAKTDSLSESLNIMDAVKDISRIGIGKVVATVVAVFIIILVVNLIVSLIGQYVPFISFINIILTPYMVFASNRATGLLYSHIA